MCIRDFMIQDLQQRSGDNIIVMKMLEESMDDIFGALIFLTHMSEVLPLLYMFFSCDICILLP